MCRFRQPTCDVCRDNQVTCSWSALLALLAFSESESRAYRYLAYYTSFSYITRLHNVFELSYLNRISSVSVGYDGHAFLFFSSHTCLGELDNSVTAVFGMPVPSLD